MILDRFFNPLPLSINTGFVTTKNSYPSVILRKIAILVKFRNICKNTATPQLLIHQPQ